jgi:hypothetical protein
MPIVSYQTSKGFYAEGRYNYEELNTFSYYMGRTFSKSATLSYSISPVAGIVIGDLNGGSVGMNVSLGYKDFYLYSQPQYTFSVEKCDFNYIYSWTDVTYSPLTWLSLGVSLQHTKPYGSKSFMQNGLIVEAAYKKFTFPLYMFNPFSKDRSITLGASIGLAFKKKKKTSEPKEPDTFKETFPVNIIASTQPKKEEVVKDKPIQKAEPVKPVKRVTVVMRTRDASSLNLEPSHSIPANKLNALSGNKEPGKRAVKTESEIFKATTPAERAASSSGVYYALLLGPFNNRKEALELQEKINGISNRNVMLNTEGTRFRLRIPGFKSQKDAESFSLILSQDFVTESAIISYQSKNIDAIPLKKSPEPFESTRL